MKTRFLVLSTIVCIAGIAIAEAIVPPITMRTLTVRGGASERHSRVLTQFIAINSPRTLKYLQDFTIFATAQGSDPLHPTGRFGSLLIKSGHIPLYFENMSEAAVFLSNIIGPITAEEEAESALLLLPEIFSYTIVTRPPRQSEDHKPKIDNEANWTRKLSRTDAGWSLTCTLLFDPIIALCKRVTIFIDRAGNMSISNEEHVYSRGGYQ